MNFLQIEQNRWVESINDDVGSLHLKILIPLHQIWLDLPPESQPTTVSSVFLVEHRDKSAIYKQFIKLLDCWMFHRTQNWNNMISLWFQNANAKWTLLLFQPKYYDFDFDRCNDWKCFGSLTNDSTQRQFHILPTNIYEYINCLHFALFSYFLILSWSG